MATKAEVEEMLLPGEAERRLGEQRGFSFAGKMGIFEQRLFLAKREEAAGDGFFFMVFSWGRESVELFFP